MNPPPIGEALTLGWERFKENAVPLILGVLVACLIFMIPIAGLGLGMPGALLVGLKAVRGQKPEIADALVGFQRPLDNIVMGLLQMAGILACCVGILFTAPVFFMGSLLIAEKGMTWQQAKDVCWEQIKPNWVGWMVYWIVLALVSQLGAIACVVGVLVTAPISYVAMAYAYDRTLGASK